MQPSLVYLLDAHETPRTYNINAVLPASSGCVRLCDEPSLLTCRIAASVRRAFCRRGLIPGRFHNSDLDVLWLALQPSERFDFR